MHNYKQNIHIGDVKSIKSKRRAVDGEDEVQEICEVVEENGRNGNRSSDLTRLPGVFQPGNLVTYP